MYQYCDYVTTLDLGIVTPSYSTYVSNLLSKKRYHKYRIK